MLNIQLKYSIRPLLLLWLITHFLNDTPNDYSNNTANKKGNKKKKTTMRIKLNAMK